MKNDNFRRWNLTDQQNNSSMKQAAFHKTLLLKTRHRQHLTPDISTSLKALQPRRTFKQNSSKKAVLSPRELTPEKRQSSAYAKSVRHQIDWSVLREEQHRPRFDHWQSKMVSQLVRRGKFQQLMSLLK